MKYVNKKDIINVIDKSSEELHLKIDMHCRLMTVMLEQRLGDGNLKEFCLPLCYHKESRLKKAVRETIDVLEEKQEGI